MKRAIQFGAGNIGRGFIGAVLSEAGYHVVFADVNMEVIDRINKDGAYTVHIMDVESRDVRISNISGVDSGGGEIVDEIVRAEIITTAVGLRILPFIAPAIAKGIAARRAAGVGEPLNVIACENGIRATSQLKEEVYKHLSAEEAAWCDAHFKYIDKIIGRFKNPYLKDDVTRVGREPLRKLSSTDRLVKPMMTAREYGLPCDKLLLGIGAALHYNNPEDPQSVKMQELIAAKGLRQAVSEITSIPATDPVIEEIAAATAEVEKRIR